MDQPKQNKSFEPHKVVIMLFIAVFLTSIWPIYPVFSRIRPVVLGLPFSLVYLIILLLFSFFVLLSLYLWESRNGRLD